MSMEKPGQTFQEIGGQTALLLRLKSIQQQSTTLIEVHFRLQISIRAHDRIQQVQKGSSSICPTVFNVILREHISRNGGQHTKKGHCSMVSALSK